MKRLWLILVFAVIPAIAQQPAVTVQTPNPGEQIQKFVRLKYADPYAIQRLLRPFGVDTQAEPQMKVLSLSGPRNRVTTAEEAIKELDVPAAAQKDIELTVFFVLASNRATPDPSLAPIPQDLQSTVATLKTTFPFKNYDLLDTLLLRARSGVGADATGQLPGNRYTSFKVGSASLDGDGAMIRLDRLHAGLRIPHVVPVGSGPGGVGAGVERRTEFIDTGMSAEIVDVKEGQKLVVGRSSVENNALFLVLIAKVVN
jgi:hypothetical protein